MYKFISEKVFRQLFLFLSLRSLFIRACNDPIGSIELKQRERTHTHGSCCCCSRDPREHRTTLLTGSRGTREKEAVDSAVDTITTSRQHQETKTGRTGRTPRPSCHTISSFQCLFFFLTESDGGGITNLRMPEGRVFPVWRGIRAGSGVGGGWSQGWGRCLRWEADSPGQKARIPVFDYPVWLVLCRGGRARLIEVCQRGRGAIRLPTDMLSIKLPELFDIHQVPKVFREDSIISGYRHPRSSALDCVLSSFQMNNETINIWTHFLPTWYFLWRFCVLCSTLNFLTDSYTWPLLVYMLLICIYPFTSSCAHTFSTMSPESRHICYFFDYGALSLYSLGCAISYGYYVIPDSWVNSWVHQHFVPIAIGNTLFCTSLSCYSRFLELQFPQRSKALRTGAFVVPFIFDTVPLFYRILLCCGGSCSSSDALSFHCYHLLFAFLTCFLFTAHLPERLAPGRFDYFGHSHQLFHVSAVVGTHFQMEGVIADMMSRRALLVAHGTMPSFLGTIGVLAVSLVLNLGIIGIFSAPLLWKPCHGSNQPHAQTRERKEQ